MFDDLLQNLRQDLKPIGAVEEELVEQIAAHMWRLRRARHIETSIYCFERAEQVRCAEHYGTVPVTNKTALGRQYRSGARDIETLQRYETTIQRSMDRALFRIKELQATRVTDLEPLEVSLKVETVETNIAAPLDAASTGSAST